MKSGRELYALAEQAGTKALPRYIAGLKGRELNAILRYADRLHPSDELRDEIIGTTLIVAANRYLGRVRHKAEKRMRKARKAL